MARRTIGIVSTPGTCSGEPRIAGTRITVRRVVSAFMDGWSIAYTAHQYGLTSDQIDAALRYQLKHKGRRRAS